MQATYPKIYYLRGLAFTKKEKWDDALAAFKLAVENIKKGDTYYVQSLIETGRICYSKKKDYICALNAYDEAVKLRPNDYTLYRSMIKACYATEKWEQADSFFVRMKKAYHMGELSDELAKWKGVPVEEFTVEDYQVLVIRHFDEPNQAGFAPYLFYVTVNKGLIIDRKVSYQLTMGPKGKLDILRLTAQYPDKFEDYELEFPLDAPYHDLREKVRGILQGIVHPRRTVPIKENK